MNIQIFIAILFSLITTSLLDYKPNLAVVKHAHNCKCGANLSKYDILKLA
ncbi:hypothetical protein GA0116948_103248 [Chitinophaga costaii]|uniref:Uncharacterized protein n=1 Tax=Chitinophaga costaii TaxID=1335309 RepID=A0A1C4BTD9_9BACT|nr:hypothetical protein GA0116948_103248 [Chitinophaga costaii]